jgi:hypothetical protein
MDGLLDERILKGNNDIVKTKQRGRLPVTLPRPVRSHQRYQTNMLKLKQEVYNLSSFRNIDNEPLRPLAMISLRSFFQSLLHLLCRIRLNNIYHEASTK